MSVTSRRVTMGGAEGFEQEVQVSRKMRVIQFTAGFCYYRPTLKSFREETVDDKGNPTLKYYPGFASRWMFQQMLGVPVKDAYLGNEDGIELQQNYAHIVMGDIFASMLAFQNAPTTVDYKKAYANFVRYIVNFAKKFKSVEEEDRPIMFLSTLEIIPTDEQKEDPDFDSDMMVIENFKEFAVNKVAGTSKENGEPFTGIEVFKLAGLKAIAEWSIKNTDIQLAYTYTLNANFNGVKFWGSIEHPLNDGGAQLEQSKALAALARFISQHEFDKTGLSGGASSDSEAYRNAFNDWLSNPKANNKIMDSPNPNGVAFVVSQECSSDGKKVAQNNGQDAPIESGLMSWSTSKTDKVKAEIRSGIAYTDPDVTHTVYKFNTSDDKKKAGQQMGVVSWDNKNLMDYKKIMALKNETMQPTVYDRINNYTPVDLEGLKVAFKRYLDNYDQSWITAEDRNKYAKAFELIEAKQTANDINSLINNTIGASNGTGISLGITTPAPTTPVAGTPVASPVVETAPVGTPTPAPTQTSVPVGVPTPSPAQPTAPVGIPTPTPVAE